MFAEGTSRPGQSGWKASRVLHWAKVWVDCCDLAGRLTDMEAKAAEAQAAEEVTVAEERYAAGAEP